MRFLLLLLAPIVLIASPVAAQSPNTASIIVVVVDQNDAVVKDAKILVTNEATGGVRDTVSGSDGSATIPGLSLTGTYTLTVSKEGFANEERKDILLRSGETAKLKVALQVGSSRSEVTIFGTTEGVRLNPQIGLPLNAPASTFGQFVGAVGTATNAIPAFANIDPSRMFQLQAKFVF